MAVCESGIFRAEHLLSIKFESFRKIYKSTALEESVNTAAEDRKSKLTGLQQLYQTSTNCPRNSFVKYFSNYFEKLISKK